VNDETLRLFNKHSTREKNRRAIEAFNAAGIRVHGMFVLGSDADTPQTLVDTLRFARDCQLTTAQFFALTAIPGPPLTRRLAKEKRILAWGDWRLFDAQHAVVCPSRISPSELQEGILRISREFYSVREVFRQLFRARDRWFNFAIRIQGNLLTRRIQRDSAAYARALSRFDQIRADLVAEIDRLAVQARSRLQSLSTNLEEGQLRIRAYLHHLGTQFDATCDRLNLELVPYGRALREMTRAKLEEHFRALLTEPVREIPGET